MKTRLILGCILVFASFGAFAGASTFSGATNDGINLSVTDLETAEVGVTVLESTLKVPGSKKDLLIGVSIESGVFTQTEVKGQKGESETATASGTIAITVLIDGVPVAPGTVKFNHREQTLSATLGGVLESCTFAVSDSGSVTFTKDDCIWTDEDINLMLETTTANHFNFIAPNVGQGEHDIEVVADVSAAASSDAKGSASSWAVINIGSLSVEVVRSANTDDGITIE
jgi:hypothetical protein